MVTLFIVLVVIAILSFVAVVRSRREVTTTVVETKPLAAVLPKTPKKVVRKVAITRKKRT